MEHHHLMKRKISSINYDNGMPEKKEKHLSNRLEEKIFGNRSTQQT